MLVTEIDRNLPFEPEKKINRVYWIFRSHALIGDSPGRGFRNFPRLGCDTKTGAKSKSSPRPGDPDYIVHLTH
ncbi:hypothetical protein UR09_03880 [Candidatus Nitromaritima sp. SCGC AAA799-A02]|nr:hypothetical protein UZ36_06055 [Candidatus Nitromaritima sp. SCGC AAA799-C22]KMP11238.1 hypothetical protein UR09_03880 [Candidatus Nitromaritima sp. SCGC AAA799-A02]